MLRSDQTPNRPASIAIGWPRSRHVLPAKVLGRIARGLYLAPALLAITACSHVPIATCPAVVPYDQQTQAKAADELEALPPDAVLRTFMDDYKTERARLRACA